ncbi:MAG: hypothetical protein MSH08_00095 [Ezakiella sp.]|nr:hypothetical protein [Ezakiella sp.]
MEKLISIFASYDIDIENKSFLEILDEMYLKLNRDQLLELFDMIAFYDLEIFGGLTNERERTK